MSYNIQGNYVNENNIERFTNNATSCEGYNCTIENQICPKGVPGATNSSYVCKKNKDGAKKWTECPTLELDDNCNVKVKKNGEGLCSDGIGGKVVSGYTKQDCMKYKRIIFIYFE